MNNRYFAVGLIMLVFFVISFLTNILGPLIPDIIQSFSLSLGLAGFLPFAFFVAYGVMSIPSGMMIEKYGEKKVMVSAFALAAAGALMFAIFSTFQAAMISLFLIGSGMAMLQVAINPLLRVAGGEEHFAFNSVLGQLAFGAASFISPQVYAYLVAHVNREPVTQPLVSLLSRLSPQGMGWVSLYWFFAAVAAVMVAVILVIKFPKVELKADEKAGSWAIHLNLFANRTVILFFIGIFCYVGTEQGVANWISQFLYTYHGFDPQTAGADAISWFWGLLTIGCVLGLVLLKFVDSQKVLLVFTAAAAACLAAGLFGGARTALYAFPVMGFFASVMWSVIISLALNSVSEHHGSFSGILCTGIVGGAVMPLIVGSLGDLLGLRWGMAFIFIPLSFIFSIGIWARPLVRNKTYT
ncbi:MAG TPA: MFS transporter [Flavilitoribacter sp.]|mgnify:CR=1 FL=1|nr:MFS transporter [Flavilitoribacter sp.]HMQ86051.1 MFS transporter [Flavilitoribacter sp.]